MQVVINHLTVVRYKHESRQKRELQQYYCELN